jgi:hypothetical protein
MTAAAQHATLSQTGLEFALKVQAQIREDSGLHGRLEVIFANGAARCDRAIQATRRFGLAVRNAAR